MIFSVNSSVVVASEVVVISINSSSSSNSSKQLRICSVKAMCMSWIWVVYLDSCADKRFG
jgi:hypothetical protein